MERKVDVIIPAYKPDNTFVQLLVGLARQSYPIQRILIMNTERQFWNPEYEKLAANIKVMHLPKTSFDHGGTRDWAARMSDADILVFMTQDAVPQNEKLIEELVKFFEMPSVKAVYARQLPAKGCTIIERYTRSFNYPKESQIKEKADLPELGIKTYFCSNVCAAYERETYLKLDGFVKYTVFNEDMIFAAKLIQSDYKVAYAANAMVVHSHNYNNMQQLRRNFDLAVSQADHPEIFDGVKSEGEGLRLVSKTASYLLKIHKPWLVFPLVLKSGFKYIGYWLGKHYYILPKKLIYALTMNRSYWE